MTTPTLRTVRCALVAAALALAACSSNDPASLVASARTYLGKNDPKAAAIQLKNALQQVPDNAEARYLLAQALLETGDAAGAEAEARKALELKHPVDEVQPLLARAELAQGAFQRVTTDFAGVALRDPKARASLATTLASAYLALGNLKSAQEFAREAASQQPNDPAVLLVQARVAAAGNDAAAAMHFADAALAQRPGEIEATLFKAQLLNVQGKRDDAVKLLEDAVKQHPNSVQLRAAIVPGLIAINQVDKAAEHVAKLRERAPNDPRTQYTDAMWSYAKGDWRHTVDALQRILAMSPDHLPSLMLTGLAQYQLGSYAVAEESLRRVLARIPDEPQARRALAATYIRTGRASAALARPVRM
jgi:putative PEP-CTERM system TPR-repeat lipoprotein